jgi:glycosyltransferase involved in cell wall biosynthesis
VGIVIPAHNEQGHIGRAVRAVRRALAHDALEASASWIVVVDDNSSDATAAEARRMLDSQGEVLGGTFGTAGASRRAGFERLLKLAAERGGFDDTWLATSDADSRVPPTWIAGQLHWWREGFDAVAGMVAPE